MAADDYHKNEFIFKTITFFRIVIGVVVTLAVLFAMVWLIDFSSERSETTYNQQSLLFHDGSEDKKIKQSGSLFEALLNKNDEKTGNVVDGVKDKSDTTAVSKSSSSARKSDGLPVERSIKPSVTQTITQLPQSANRPALPLSAAAGVFAVQLGSFQQVERARIFSEDLASKGYRTYIKNTAMPNGKTMYRVRIGRFNTREEAMDLATKIERVEKISVFVTSQ